MVLDSVQAGYQCTYSSLGVDVEMLRAEFDQDKRIVIAAITLAATCINAVSISVFILMDYKMLMRWYKENPLKTNQRYIRSIQVGISPDDIGHPQQNDNSEVIAKGAIVPEADREQLPISLRIIKQISVPALPVKDETDEEEEQNHAAEFEQRVGSIDSFIPRSPIKLKNQYMASVFEAPKLEFEPNLVQKIPQQAQQSHRFDA